MTLARITQSPKAVNEVFAAVEPPTLARNKTHRCDQLNYTHSFGLLTLEAESFMLKKSGTVLHLISQSYAGTINFEPCIKAEFRLQML